MLQSSRVCQALHLWIWICHDQCIYSQCWSQIKYISLIPYIVLGFIRAISIYPLFFPWVFNFKAIWAKLNPALATKRVSKYACGLRCDRKRWCVRCRELHLWRAKKCWEILGNWEMVHVHSSTENMFEKFLKTPEYFPAFIHAIRICKIIKKYTICIVPEEH